MPSLGALDHDVLTPCSSAALFCATQARPRLQLPQERIVALTERIQDAGTEVVKAKVSIAQTELVRRPCSVYNWSIPPGSWLPCCCTTPHSLRV